MVRSRMEARLEALERNFEEWRQTMTEDREVRGTRQELADARLRRVEELLEALVHRSDGGATSGASENAGERRGATGRQLGEVGEDKWRKLEIPLFAGEDAYGWVSRLERYFQIKKVSEAERLEAIPVAVEGKALTWYQWWENSLTNPTWEGFKLAVIRRFQPSMMQNPYELLLGLK